MFIRNRQHRDARVSEWVMAGQKAKGKETGGRSPPDDDNQHSRIHAGNASHKENQPITAAGASFAPWQRPSSVDQFLLASAVHKCIPVGCLECMSTEDPWVFKGLPAGGWFWSSKSGGCRHREKKCVAVTLTQQNHMLAE